MEITKEYYYTILEMMHSKTTNLKAYKMERRNGTYSYYTYHLARY